MYSHGFGFAQPAPPYAAETGSSSGAAKATPTAPLPTSTPTFSWSSRPGAQVYRRTACTWVRNIAPSNLQKGNTAPGGKRLHECTIHQ
jgi:hypothetical protein